MYNIVENTFVNIWNSLVIRVSTSNWAAVTHCWIVKWLLLTISWLIRDPRAVIISGWPITPLHTLDLPYQILSLQTKYGGIYTAIISNWFSSSLLSNSVAPITSPPKNHVPKITMQTKSHNLNFNVLSSVVDSSGDEVWVSFDSDNYFYVKTWFE